MKDDNMIDIERMADKHWKWISGLLAALERDTCNFPIEALEYLYTTAMIHGYWHGWEDAGREGEA